MHEIDFLFRFYELIICILCTLQKLINLVSVIFLSVISMSISLKSHSFIKS